MKTYTINGKEIEGFTGNIRKMGEFEGVEMTSIESKINEILEALDEKKEEREWTKCDCIYYNGIERKCALHLKLQKEEEPKSEIGYYKDSCPYCGSEDFTMTGDKEYNDYYECDKCNQDFASFKSIYINESKPNVKQKLEPKSTLRESIADKIQGYIFEDKPNSEVTADKIISLFKDTLIKNLPLLKVENWTVNAMPQFSAENKAHNDAIREIEQLIKNL